MVVVAAVVVLLPAVIATAAHLSPTIKQHFQRGVNFTGQKATAGGHVNIESMGAAQRSADERSG